jgi:hypothetical protein
VSTTTTTVSAPTLSAFEVQPLQRITVGQSHFPIGDVRLSGPAITDTLIQVSSDDPTCLSVDGAGATVPVGGETQMVFVTALKPCIALLTATFGSVAMSVSLVVTNPSLVSINTDVVEYLRVGQTGGIASVELSGPATADTFVSVTSSDPTCLSITGGGTTVPVGRSVVGVGATGLRACASVTLTATLGAVSLTATTTIFPA